jgi:hypothetical protein
MYHRDVLTMRGQKVIVQEKVDGSQISFGRKLDGILHGKSHKQQLDMASPNTMFGPAIASIKRADDKMCMGLAPNYIFRGEYLSRPKHNILSYDRIPKQNIIIFDIEAGDDSKAYFPPDVTRNIAEKAGFEVVPTIWEGLFDDLTQEVITRLLKTQSILGGQLIEGIVIKCYAQRDANGNTLMCKYVRDDFKEMNGGKKNKVTVDIVEQIGDSLAVPARFEKAVLHAKEDCKLVGEMDDIAVLMRELNIDFEEHVDEIKTMLYSHYRKQIQRVANRGFATWYKGKLMSQLRTADSVQETE